jgi:hypothetical protein
VIGLTLALISMDGLADDSVGDVLLSFSVRLHS